MAEGPNDWEWQVGLALVILPQLWSAQSENPAFQSSFSVTFLNAVP